MTAQSINKKIIIIDSLTLEPIINVSILNKDGDKNLGYTNESGAFYIKNGMNSIMATAVGYDPIHVNLATSDSIIHIKLKSKPSNLNDVIVTAAKKKKYRNKNNPAVELIKKVIEHKPENDINYFPTASYDEYAKLSFFVDRFPKWMSKSKILKKYDFVLRKDDTVTMPGKNLLPIYLEESVSKNYTRNKPKSKNSIVKAEKRVDYGKFIDIRGISSLFNRLFEDINIYNNNIEVFTKQFLSPISNAGPVWYKYFIQDTIEDEGLKLIRLHFVPRNDADLLFNGEMYITLDGRYAVKSIEFQTDDNINLGVVRNFSVVQRFNKDTAGHFYLGYSEVTSDFGLYKKMTGLIGRRVINNTGFLSGMPIDDSIWKMNEDVLLRNPKSESDTFWTSNRSIPLDNGESQVYGRMDSLRKMKSFQRATDWFNTITSGYKTFGKVQAGPVQSFIDYNPVEGFKPRFGGRTTPDFNKSIYFNGNLAYGFRDERLKYFGRATYAFNHKSIYSYPVHSLSITKIFDSNIPGTSDINEEGNLFFASNTGNFNRYFYNNIIQVDYLKEFDDHWAISFGFKDKIQRTTGDWAFIRNMPISMDSIYPSIKSAQLSMQVRWAPHEQFYQNGARRLKIPNRFPVFTFDFTKGIKGLFNGNYDYNYFHLNVQKRVYMSILGMSKMTLDGGYLTGSLPWPLLIIHTGNQGLGYSTTGFNLMNYMEFMSDHYASFSIEHLFNGLFFNRIPLIKKLKWREIAGAKILFGGVRNENNPSLNPNVLLKLPYTDKAPSYFLSGKPYIEVSAGVSNIFKFLRVDLIKRMTYLDHPDINKWSLKAAINFEL